MADQNQNIDTSQHQIGDTKTGDTKSVDTKTGDTKTGDTKTGDTKTGDTKTGDNGKFDFASWKQSGSDVSKLPAELKPVWEAAIEKHKSSQKFDAIKSLRTLIDESNATVGNRQPVKQQQIKDDDDGDNKVDIEAEFNKRLAQVKAKERVDSFRKDFESFVGEPVKIGEGHSYVFDSKDSLESFVKYSRDFLAGNGVTPRHLYTLWNLDRILADHSEWSGRQKEEALRKAAGGAGNQTVVKSGDDKNKTDTGGKGKGEPSDYDLSVEDWFKKLYPDQHKALKSGDLRFSQ